MWPRWWTFPPGLALYHAWRSRLFDSTLLGFSNPNVCAARAAEERGRESSLPEQRRAACQRQYWYRRLTPLDARRHVSAVFDRSLRTVDAEHYVERSIWYRQPIGHRHTRRQLLSHVNRHRAVSVKLRRRVAGDRVFVGRVRDQFYRLRCIRRNGPEAHCLRKLPRREG